MGSLVVIYAVFLLILDKYLKNIERWILQKLKLPWRLDFIAYRIDLTWSALGNVVGDPVV